MADERVELAGGIVLRLPARTFDDTEFSAEDDAADSGDFKLSSKEMERVTNGDGIGALSVWDKTRTTAAQACAILPPKPRLVLEIDPAEIVGLPFGLHVFISPLPNTVGPGADGHCDVEDVWQGNDAKNKKIRYALAALACPVGRHMP